MDKITYNDSGFFNLGCFLSFLDALMPMFCRLTVSAFPCDLVLAISLGLLHAIVIDSASLSALRVDPWLFECGIPGNIFTIQSGQGER